MAPAESRERGGGGAWGRGGVKWGRGGGKVGKKVRKKVWNRVGKVWM